MAQQVGVVPEAQVDQQQLNENQLPTKNGKVIEYLQPALVVGIGSTGLEIIYEIRKRMLDWSEVGHLPVVDYLALETHADNLESGKLLTQEEAIEAADIQLEAGQQFHLACPSLDRFVQEEIKNQPHLSWVHPEAMKGDLQTGAQNKRTLGRFAIFHNSSGIITKARDAFREIVSEDAQRRLGDLSQDREFLWERSEKSPPILYIVGTLAGGTCSGGFIDLAYMLRHELGKIGNLTVIGIFALPSQQGGEMSAVRYANVYSALKELNHFSYPDVEYQAQFSQASTSEVSPARGTRPFDFVYLVGGDNQSQTPGPPGNRHLTYSEQKSMIAHNIFLDITSYMMKKKFAEWSNFKQYAERGDRALNPTYFSTFGLSAIRFPRDRIIRVCTYEMARRIVDDWNRTPQGLRDQQHLKEKVKGELKELDISSVLKNYLYRADTPHDPRKALREWANEKNAQVSQLVDEDQCDGIRNWLEAEVLAYRHERLRGADPNYDPLERHRNDLGTSLQTLYDNLLSTIAPVLNNRTIGVGKKRLDNLVHQYVEDPSYRIGGARQVLQFAREILTDYQHDAEKQMRTAIQHQDECEKRAQTHLNDIGHAANHRIAANRRQGVLEASQRYLDHISYRESNGQRVAGVIENAMDVEAYFHAAVLFRELAKYASELEHQLNKLQATLTDVSRQFKERQQQAQRSRIEVVGEELDWRLEDYYTADASLQEAGVGREVLEKLAGGQIFDLRKVRGDRLMTALSKAARVHFHQIKSRDALRKWLETHPWNEAQPNPTSQEALRKVYAESSVYLSLGAGLADYHWTQDEGNYLQMIGLFNGDRPDGLPDEEEDFRALLRRISGSIQMVAVRNRDEIVFYREFVGFPLRMISSLRNWQTHYSAHLRSPEVQQNPLHSRSDLKISDWESTDNPKTEEQKRAWEIFFTAWASGQMDLLVDRQGATVFKIEWHDVHGVSHDHTTPPFLRPPQRTSQHQRPDATTDPLTPPLEARAIILDLLKASPQGTNSGLLAVLNSKINECLSKLGPDRFRERLIQHREIIKRQYESSLNEETHVHESWDFFDVKYEAMHTYLRESWRSGALKAHPVEELLITPFGSVKVGDTVHLQATAKNRNGARIDRATPTWNSANPTVAEISEDGTLTAKARGSATITARYQGANGLREAHVDIDVQSATQNTPAGKVVVPTPSLELNGDGVAATRKTLDELKSLVEEEVLQPDVFTQKASEKIQQAVDDSRITAAQAATLRQEYLRTNGKSGHWSESLSPGEILRECKRRLEECRELAENGSITPEELKVKTKDLEAIRVKALQDL